MRIGIAVGQPDLSSIANPASIMIWPLETVNWTPRACGGFSSEQTRFGWYAMVLFQGRTNRAVRDSCHARLSPEIRFFMGVFVHG